jgi:GNAT superfamily N-acetyltransferase
MQNDHNSSDFLIRWCLLEEIDWVNQKYQKIDFQPSHLDTDRIAIAICNGERVGLGRLCHVDGSVFELGGMHVEPSYRGVGIARKIVKFIIDYRNSKDRVYCLPFAHLRGFYESEGFKKVAEEELSRLPKDLLEKHRWCNETYLHEVLLLEFYDHK